MDEEKALDERIKKLIKPLTQLQKRFVHGLVKGSTQRQAYIDAKGTAKTDASRDACASDMLSSPKVSAYYDALMEKAQLDSVMTKAEALRILSEQAREENKDPSVVRNTQGAIKQISTMLSWDAPKRTELTGKDGGAIEVKGVKDMTDDELLLIAGEGE